MPATLHVCTTCRVGEIPTEGRPCPGARLAAALAEALARAPDPELVLAPVECLSACSQGAALALSGPGLWSYIYGGLSTADTAEILRGAALYARSPDGIVPWRERPQLFRKQTVARLPPQPVAQAATATPSPSPKSEETPA